MPRAALSSSSIAVWIAIVVTPAPPTAARKVWICASLVSVAAAGRATRAQVRTSSIGCTGFTRKSATRICSSRRATSASKLARHHDRRAAPVRAIRRSSACISSCAASVEVDDDDGRGCRIERVAGLGNGGRDHLEIDLRARVERGADKLIESRVHGENHHAGPVRRVCYPCHPRSVLLPCRHVLKDCDRCLAAPTPTSRSMAP